ncbi:MAG: diacylglycerol kinase [Mycobacterium sp.]
MTYRVIQWGTGNTGAWSVRAMAARPDLELVGVKVYSDSKAGRDAGELCGIGDLGVITTTDRDQLITTDADVVVYMASAESNPEQCAADIYQLLASGKNVVATPTPFQHPAAVSPELGAALSAACETGKSSFLGLGIFPGFIPETVTATLLRICHQVEHVRVSEAIRYDKYPSRELMFTVMGFGSAPDDATPLLANLEYVRALYIGAVTILADACNLELDEVTGFRDTEVATTDLQVASGLIKAGTVAAMRMGVRATYHGRTAMTVEHCTRMDPDLAPQWPAFEGYEIEVAGMPSLSCHLAVGIKPGDDHTDQACLATAAHALHAIPAVIVAAPGVHTLASIGPFSGGDAFTLNR